MNIDPEKFTELGLSAIREMAEVAKRNGQQEGRSMAPYVCLDGPGKWNCSSFA